MMGGADSSPYNEDTILPTSLKEEMVWIKTVLYTWQYLFLNLKKKENIFLKKKKKKRK